MLSPCDDDRMKKTIAIVGSGMAGLAAARIFKDAGFDVTIFEALPAHGMDSHTLFMHDGIVDVPLRVMSPLIWKNTLSLAKYVGVNTFEVNTFISCSWEDGKSWFRTSRHPSSKLPIVGSLRYLNINTGILVKNFIKMAWVVRQLKKQPNAQLTLGEFLEQYQFHPLFWRGIMLPILTTICTCQESYLMDWPAFRLLEILEKIMHGETLVRLNGGTPALVKGLSKGITFISGSPVTQVSQQAEQVLVKNERGDAALFDRVIIATPTSKINFLADEQCAEELHLLKQFAFDRGELWVHDDPRLMPRKKQDWTALNFLMKPDLSTNMFTVWVNQVEPTLQGKPPIFQTWNPIIEPRAEHVISRTPLVRAVVNQQSCAALEKLEVLQSAPDRQIYFCGSWASSGIPLLESAVQSAIRVAKHCNVPISFQTFDLH
jgi:predicted NAD/FAD-binding protein